jgi:DNA-binding transcriptional regulator YhcF (GntR family)
MQLWFSRRSDVSLREQLATQIVLAIVSGELAPGQRLPSTRELARRFRLHPNTVSAGYRQLERSHWLESRKGSGVYVRAQKPELPSSVALDQLAADFFRAARKLNAPLAEVRSRLRHWLELQPPDHFVLIEPDEQLARIVVSEMRKAVTLPVQSCEPQSFETSGLADGAIPAAISFSLKAVRDLLSRPADLLTLHLRSAGESLARHLPTSRAALVGIASAWEPFLKNARTMLIAAGFHPDCLVVRDTARSGWQRGLKETAAIVCDSLTAELADGMPRVLSFPLLAESSLKELREYEQFIRSPLEP